MEMTGAVGSDNQFVSELQSCAKLLIDKLQDDDFENAYKLIRTMYEVRDRHIFNSVGRLTRALHDAIVNFNVDADIHAKNPALSTSDISDATDRLQYVIKMTQDAANKTMDRVEIAAPIALNLGHEAALLRKEWEKLRKGEMNKDEFVGLYARISDFLEQMGDGTHQLSENLQAIILDQGYQDLTGQVLKKVIGLITDVEAELVNLVRIAGQVEEVAGIPEVARSKEKNNKDSIAAEGPVMHANLRDDTVNGQDAVDDLLSSLGF
jgi:chemotaxis protein CheZ